MAKHFEFLWEEAELVAEQFYVSSRTIIETDAHDHIRQGLGVLEVLEEAGQITEEEKEEMLGKVIFGLCLFSKRLDINAYSALRAAIDNAKIEMLDDDIKSE